MQANAGFHSRAIYIINCLNLVWGHFTKEIVRRYSFVAEARNRPSFPLVRPSFPFMQANAGFHSHKLPEFSLGPFYKKKK